MAKISQKLPVSVGYIHKFNQAFYLFMHVDRRIDHQEVLFELRLKGPSSLKHGTNDHVYQLYFGAGYLYCTFHQMSPVFSLSGPTETGHIYNRGIQNSERGLN